MHVWKSLEISNKYAPPCMGWCYSPLPSTATSKWNCLCNSLHRPHSLIYYVIVLVRMLVRIIIEMFSLPVHHTQYVYDTWFNPTCHISIQCWTIFLLTEYGEYHWYKGLNLVSKFSQVAYSTPVKVINDWWFLEWYNPWKGDWSILVRAHLLIWQSLLCSSVALRKCFIFASENIAASKGSWQERSKNSTTKLSLSHDDFDIVASGQRTF
jgi:hypothetical protein